ncbi:4Fe-4S dicluster domain-containing protein [Syntrophorhabdus aromaticivorans]|jgi:ferredoxin|uniref:4Fe-4S dicluster domain-containing protein n=1 Tax=Syntrophorhabdus aromaticivorans TaxID=328301 RepID=UPI0004075A9C|nr:4Fe-4S dicluster domain-containing protein [Syntrophorhabdus aromaticivorans]
MADTGFIPKEKWKAFIEGLSTKAQVWVPCLEGDTVIFRPFSKERNLCFERPANSSPKSVIFPQSDTLFSFKFTKDPETPQKVEVELTENKDFPKTILFGARPCDARGFTVYDRPYTETDTPDPYYKGRREQTTIVTMACQTSWAGCFCTSVEGGPADKTGSDAMITEVEKGYFVEPITEKGKSLLQEPGVEDGSAYQGEARKEQDAVRAMVRKPFGDTVRPKVSKELFDKDEFWEEALAKCLSCGACTYLCPTCYCFNITDEHQTDKGERIRSWDGCMYYHFTLEASGHNPRPTKFQRYKNRVGHKFLFYPEKYNNVIACSGCGRCIRYCPVSVDISEIVSNLQEPGAEAPAQGGNDKKAGSASNG